MRAPDSTESRHGESRPEQHRAGPWLSLVLRAEQPFAPPARFNLRQVDEVTFGRGACFGVTRPGDPREHGLLMALGDSLVSRTHARLQRVMGEWVVDDLGSKNGTWVNGDDIQRRRLEDGDVFEIGRSFFLFRQAGRALEGGPDLQPKLPARPGTVTLHPAWEEDLSLLAKVAPSTVPVVLRGETGSGKEVAARNLHHLSGRPGRFVAVNCGAIPEDLIESELFGHRRGAFTGATRESSGLLRASDHGTLLLDEVGDLPLSSQPALLRALQEREVTPVGGIQPLPVDLRVVCATHQDLEALVSQGSFRVDLLSRISGLTASLPSLRDRREDLGLLVGELLGRMGVEPGMGFTLEAARALMLYRWPGNIRELERSLESAAVLAGAGPIALQHLPRAIREPAPVLVLPAHSDEERHRPLTPEEQAHRDQLLRLLAAEEGNVAEVARRLQKGRTQVQRWIHRYEIDLATLRH